MKRSGTQFSLILLTALLIFSFQNCKELTPGTNSKNGGQHTLTRGQGGEGYGGKAYLEIVSEGECSDGRIHATEIQAPGDGKAYLVRENCKEVAPIAVDIQSGDDSGQFVLYNNKRLFKAGEFFSNPGFENGPQANPRDAANTFYLSTRGSEDEGVLADAARSGQWGLRLNRNRFDTSGHFGFLKNQTRYRLSFWARVIKHESPSGAFLRLLTFDRGQWSSAENKIYNSDITNRSADFVHIKDPNWTRYEVEFYVSSPAPYYNVQFRLGGTENVVDLDDFAIEEVVCGGGCTSMFPLSEMPWLDLIGKNGYLLDFPEGRLDFDSSPLKVLPYSKETSNISPRPPEAIVGAKLSVDAAYQGNNGFKFAGHSVRLVFPDIVSQNIKADRKYRVQFWARRIPSYPSMSTAPMPLAVLDSSAYVRTNRNGKTKAGTNYSIQIDDINWKPYQIILEPLKIKGFIWQHSIEIQPNSDTVHLDEITIEEL